MTFVIFMLFTNCNLSNCTSQYEYFMDFMESIDILFFISIIRGSDMVFMVSLDCISLDTLTKETIGYVPTSKPFRPNDTDIYASRPLHRSLNRPCGKSLRTEYRPFADANLQDYSCIEKVEDFL